MAVEPRGVVAVTDRIGPYTLPILSGAREVLEAAGAALLVHRNDSFVKNVPDELSRRLSANAHHGVISLALSTPEAHRAVEVFLRSRPDLPVVTLGGGPGNLTTVVPDNRSGMRAVMTHLLDEQGARRIVLVRGIPHHPDSIEREAVVREELARHGLELPEVLIVDGGFEREDSYRGVLALLRTGALVDAVVALNDNSAIGAVDAVLDFGLQVPQDVAVTGFDDDTSLRARRPLTTVDQDLHGQGATAARLLITQLDGGSPVGRILVPTHLIVRRSSLRRETQPSWHAAEHHPPAIRQSITVPFAYRHELNILDSVLAMNRAFMECHTEQDVMRALEVSLPRLEITRCFVVLNMPNTSQPPNTGPIGRLALAYPSPQPERETPGDPGETFPTDLILPRRLQHELRSGTLLLQSLALAGQELGYVLYRQPTLSDVTAEVLRMDLTRALDGIARQRHLERLVAERTETLNAEVAVRRRAEAELSVVNAELSVLNTELRRSADLDGLTGLANRRAFDSYLHRVWDRHRETGESLSVVFVDVDHFKLYNDHYGHLVGDDALRAVSDALLRSSRSSGDLVARFGGEEFVVVLPSTTPAGALGVAERIRTLVHRSAVPHAASPVSRWLTVSQSVATVVPRADDDGPRGLLDAADRGLYRAKAEGRDRIAVVGSHPDDTPITRKGAPQQVLT